MDESIRLRMPDEYPEPLYLMDKTEWWDVCKKINPGLTESEYDSMWDEFQAKKAIGVFEAPPQ
jgi:hypothetical protein